MKRKRQRSFGEYYIKCFLDYNSINYIREKKFPKCRSNKNYLLRFDFYLDDYNILIEYQGQHHFKPVNKGQRGKSVHKKTLENDQIKKQFCKDNNIQLLTINYWELKDIFSILEKQLNELVFNI